ncbi:GspE/PulE family protein [Megalodesulfovibrio paquesii]
MRNQRQDEKSDTFDRNTLQRLGALLGWPFLQREAFPPLPVEASFLNDLSKDYLRARRCLPAAQANGDVLFILSDPFDLPLLAALRQTFGASLACRLALAEEIAMAFDHLYLQEDAESEPQPEETGQADEVDPARLRDLAREASVVRKVDWCINAALDARASDIHFEPADEAVLVRFRIDGRLHVRDTLPKTVQPALISRLKLMANLDIAERRLPQDGQIVWKSLGRTVDVRVSTTPALHGESVVLRLLTKERAARTLQGLGLGPEQAALLESLGRKTHGMVLVVGPTGSGKTTTLHALLCAVRDETRKIMTVEDPVEYHIEGVSQVQVNPRIDLTFASALRSFLRQDPDVLLVGEIRDPETARIAVQAALTGHLMLSTLHTKDAPAALPRLRDLGVEPYLLADCLLAVLAQRLVRVLCPACRTPRPALPEEMLSMAEAGLELPSPCMVYDPGTGCAACGGTGWSGREGIYELLLIDDALRRAVMAGEDAGTLAALGRVNGYAPMATAGMRKVLAGQTTLAELLRVINLE